MGKTGLEKFSSKMFGESSATPKVAVPTGGGRLSAEERRQLAGPQRKRGRPAGKKGNQVPMNFLVDVELRDAVYELKERLHRGSVKDLFVEAMSDLMSKYSEKS